MPKTKKTAKTPPRNRKGYVMVELNEPHQKALDWLLCEAAKLHGTKPAKASFIRTMIWQTYAAQGGLGENEGPF